MSEEACDESLRALALLLPRANLAPADVKDMLKLYHGLLAKHGVTARMLSEACERYVMAPSKDNRGKFFPDPGQLFDLCRDDVSTRNMQRAALECAKRILAGGSIEKQDTTYGPHPTVAEVLAKFEPAQASA